MKFPLILSGPILRRVEPANVYIWIATSQSSQISASVFKLVAKSKCDSISYQQIDIQTDTKSIRLGNKLFIHLLKASPLNGSFPVDTLLGYNLHFQQDSDIQDLESLQLLSHENPQSIVYGKLNYPTFQIKVSRHKCNIVYGSCRKLHGEGDDTLPFADVIVEKEFDS